MKKKYNNDTKQSKKKRKEKILSDKIFIVCLTQRCDKHMIDIYLFI